MSKINPIIVIPSRLGATRLPNKPLRLINGLPMIVQVINRCLKSKINQILVAVAEQEIIDVIAHHYPNNPRVNAVLTSPLLNTGSDRIHQALLAFDKEKKYNYVINVQGDLPTISCDAIDDCLNLLTKDNVDISTLVAPIHEQSDVINPNIVKAVLSFNDSQDYGKAIYFSRCQVPSGAKTYYHHIGIYGYKRDILEKFTSLNQGYVEKLEKLEQLRALENNISIYAKISKEIPLGVDVEEDLKKAEIILNSREDL